MPSDCMRNELAPSVHVCVCVCVCERVVCESACCHDGHRCENKSECSSADSGRLRSCERDNDRELHGTPSTAELLLLRLMLLPHLLLCTVDKQQQQLGLLLSRSPAHVITFSPFGIASRKRFKSVDFHM